MTLLKPKNGSLTTKNEEKSMVLNFSILDTRSPPSYTQIPSIKKNQIRSFYLYKLLFLHIGPNRSNLRFPFFAHRKEYGDLFSSPSPFVRRSWNGTKILQI